MKVHFWCHCRGSVEFSWSLRTLFARCDVLELASFWSGERVGSLNCTLFYDESNCNLKTLFDFWRNGILLVSGGSGYLLT